MNLKNSILFLLVFLNTISCSRNEYKDEKIQIHVYNSTSVTVDVKSDSFKKIIASEETIKLYIDSNLNIYKIRASFIIKDMILNRLYFIQPKLLIEERKTDIRKNEKSLGEKLNKTEFEKKMKEPYMILVETH